MKLHALIWLAILPFFGFSQNYWQQEVNTTIQVELHPETNTLTGNIEMEYHNNSPETLNEIYIHLWPNAYADKNTAFGKQQLIHRNKEFYINDELRGGITDLAFSADGISVQFDQFNNAGDIAILTLNEPLYPNESVKLKSPFAVQLPPLLSRMGVAENIYNITQWFPKPAVFDEQGWHPMPYLDQGEFYSEFGSYDVSITVPANFVVSATGVLQTPSEKEWLAQLSTATAEALAGNGDFSEAEHLKQERTGKKTIQYIQDKVHDFAWFASPEFLVLTDSVAINDNVVELQTFCKEEDIYAWETANTMLANAMQFFSEQVGPYPYQNYKAVCGGLKAGSGMEYPMITVLTKFISDLELKNTLTHELAHNWFQGVLGSNERDYAWLDEAFASFYTSWFLADEVDAEMKFEPNELSTYQVSRHEKSPIQQEASKYHSLEYGATVYSKGESAINYLKEYVGEEQFTNALQSYYNTWKFKHPNPERLQQSFANADELDWFFDDLLQQDKVLNYALKSVKGNTATIENTTDFSAPFTISVVNENGEEVSKQWVDGFKGEQEIEINVPAQNHTVEIFHEPLYYEYNRANNARTANNKIAKSLEVITPLSPLRKGLGSNENAQLFVAPMLGYNAYDRLQIGGTITNTSILEKPFEYQFIPMYGTNTSELVGFGDVRAHLYSNNKTIQQVEPYTRIRRYTYEINPNYNLDYVRGEIGATIHFEPSAEQPHFKTQKLNINTVLNDVEPIPFYDVATQTYIPRERKITPFFNASYAVTNNRPFNPNQLQVQAQAHEQFGKVSANYTYRYDFAIKGLYARLRAFAGTMLYTNDEMPFGAYFSAIGRSGANDYDVSNVYFYREQNENILANLWHEQDGGLKTMQNYALPADYYGKSMASLNAEVTVPITMPIGNLLAYSDVAFFNKPNITSISEASALYDAGVGYSLGEVLKLYYPFLISNEFKPASDIEDYGFKEKLVFQLNLNPLNFKHEIRKIIDNIQ